MEEAGWGIEQSVPIGFMHLRHLKPEGYAYPHPDFLWLVYASEATSFDPTAKGADDYEWEACIRSPASIADLAITDESLLYLDAALRDRGFLA